MRETVTLVTCRDAAEARRIARALVRERLAACVNVVPQVTSVYAWKGRVEEGREALLVIKSRAALSRKLAARVKALHSYEVPEVVTLRIAGGLPAYLRWVRESTR
ncbi:MAG: divalent-cation tolerance protein CutA [Planctomycetota bacterium]